MTKNKKAWIIIAVVALVFVVSVVLIVFRGRKPLKNIELVSATVQLLPPDKTIQIEDLDELEDLLEDIVIYNQDNSYTEYAGQAVVFSITMSDGSYMEITAYNPFVIIDGIGYKCKYEPCEKLNSYANELLNNARKEYEDFPNWGLTLSVKDVTSSGLTLIVTQSDGELTGELQTGSDYNLMVLKDGTWQDVPTIIEEYGWTAEAYTVPKNDSVEFKINWEWLYGKLSAGTYRITKGFMDFRKSGDYDNFAYWTEFEIK